MHHASRLGRTLAITTTLAVATLGVVGTAAAELAPGKSRGHAHGAADHRNGHHGSEGQDRGRNKGRSAGAPHGVGAHGGHAGAGAQQGGKSGNHGQRGQHGGHGDPAGNNGTVKITPIGEDDGTPQNTPHVVCGFDVEWYGFDEGPGIISEVDFESWAPTAVPMTVSGPAEVFVGGDPASGAGTDSGFDGEATYQLDFAGEPHPQQGYHVKLTVHTPGSQGADTKHKVFWVEPCEEQAVQSDQDDTGQDTAPEQLGEQAISSPEVEDEADVLGEQETAPSADTAPADDEVEVRGVQATRGVPTAVAAGLGVAERLGSGLGVILVLLGGLATAAGFVFRRRRA